MVIFWVPLCVQVTPSGEVITRPPSEGEIATNTPLPCVTAYQLFAPAAARAVQVTASTTAGVTDTASDTAPSPTLFTARSFTAALPQIFGIPLHLGTAGERIHGSPRVEGVSVEGTVVEQDRDAKIRVFKYKKRKHYRRTRGHRQAFTALRIDAVRA